MTPSIPATLIPGDGESRAHKLAAIRRLMEDFPERRVLLIGDSGELAGGEREQLGAVADDLRAR